MNVEKSQLQAVLDLLNESKRLHEGGHYEAHEVALEAREMLQKIIREGGTNGEKSTG